MPETRARDLANLAGAGATSSTVAYHETSRAFTLPAGTGEANQVISSDGDGTTQWKTTLSAPEITSVTSDKGVNAYDSDGDDGAVIVVNGTALGNDASALTVEISTDNFVTTVQTSTISILTNGTQIQATFNGTETNYNTINAGETVKVKVTKSALQSAQSATLSGTVTGDPTFSTTSTTVSTHTGTLPATSLGSYGGQVAGGGDDSNTKLLLNFDRTGGTDIEDSSNKGSDGHKVTATNAVIKASPFGDGKSAMFFNGSSTFLQIPSSTDFYFNTSFTIEFWIYFNTLPTSGDTHLFLNANDAGTNYVSIMYNGTNGIKTYDSGNGWNFNQGNTDGWVAKKWRHVALVRDGNTSIKIFVDGKEVGSNASSPSGPNSNQYNIAIGGYLNSTQQGNFAGGWFDGYLDELRVVNGTAVYTGDFDVPISRLTAITNTKLLIHSDSLISDVSNYNHKLATEDANGIHLKGITGRANWGNSVLTAQGSVDGKLITEKSSNFNVGSSDFCIEFWYKSSSHTNNGRWFEISNTLSSAIGTPHLLFYQETATAHYFVWNDGSSTGSIHWGTTIYDGNWHHLALTRTGSTIAFYVDGIAQTASGTSGTFPSTLTLSDHYLGLMSVSWISTLTIDGEMDDFRIVIGEKVYGANFNNHLPTGPLTKTGGQYNGTDSNRTDPTASQTKFLANFDGGGFTDSSTSDHPITVTGSYHSQMHGGIAPALTWPTNGKVTGSAGAYFDGTGDRLDVTVDGSIWANNWSWECWFYVEAGNNQDSDQKILFGLSHTGGKANFGVTTANKLALWWDHDWSSPWHINGDSGGAGTATLNNYTWYHVLFKKTSGTLAWYIDGSSSADGNFGSLGSNANMNSSLTQMRIGSWESGAQGFFKGYIDGVRFSSTERTPSLPTKIYGAYRSQDVGTIQLNASAGTGGGALDYAELSGGTALSTYGLSLSSSGAITGTLTGLAENSNSGGVVRIRARANADDNRVTTLGGNTNFTGITQNDKAPVLFNARRYVGTGATRDINGFGFAPDLVWIKNRDASKHHRIVDNLRGSSQHLASNLANAASTQTTMVTALNSDGFSAGSSDNVNSDAQGMIAWGWKAGGANLTNGTKVVNGTSSSLTSGTDYGAVSGTTPFSNIRQSINTEGGFSITRFVLGDVSASSYSWFKHGLGGANDDPDWVLIKRLDGSDQWRVWHSGVGAWSLANSGGRLDTTVAFTGANLGGAFRSGSSSGMPTGDGKIWVNQNAIYAADVNDEFICYAWKSVAGVSAFGSHTGQISSVSGDTVGQGGYCGFKPRMVIIRCISHTEYWLMFDQFRETTDTFGNYVFANESNSESSGTGITVTVTDNGFTTGSASGVGLGTQEYISMAFA